jgi:hypothetical protein
LRQKEFFTAYRCFWDWCCPLLELVWDGCILKNGEPIGVLDSRGVRVFSNCFPTFNFCFGYLFSILVLSLQTARGFANISSVENAGSVFSLDNIGGGWTLTSLLVDC